MISVTRLGDFLLFGQPFKAGGNNYFTQGKVSKSFIFLVKSFLVNFYRHLAIFIWSHCIPTIHAIHIKSLIYFHKIHLKDFLEVFKIIALAKDVEVIFFFCPKLDVLRTNIFKLG